MIDIKVKIMLAIVIDGQSIFMIGFVLGVLGVGLLGFQPFAFQSVTELAYPIPESIAVNMMIIFANLLGVVGNFVTTSSGKNFHRKKFKLLETMGYGDFQLYFFHVGYLLHSSLKVVTKNQELNKKRQELLRNLIIL